MSLGHHRGSQFFWVRWSGQCPADHTIVMADYYEERTGTRTILPHCVVAFINGKARTTLTEYARPPASLNNPAEFCLHQTEVQRRKAPIRVRRDLRTSLGNSNVSTRRTRLDPDTD